ncbi:MAG: lamin tail domain-containing protein [bacterium]|nr:lamin tail domain-containing protein [bacterium]
MNMRLDRGRILSLLIPFVILISMTTAGQADIILSEILADPMTDWSGDGIIDYKNDEWVEISNRGTETIDLADYWISDSVTSPVYRYQFSGELGAGEALYVTGAMAVAWQEEFGLGSAGLSLSNSGGVVALYRDTQDGAQFVDSYEYRSYQIDDNRSMARVPLTSDDWVLFDGLNMYHGNQEPGSTACLPSPGVLNQCEGVSVVASSWSKIKSHYPN